MSAARSSTTAGTARSGGAGRKTQTTARAAQEARERARRAKAALDAERAAREQRIEDVATDFYAALAARDEAAAVVAAHELDMSRAVSALADLDESVDRIAALCGLEPTDVRRLRRLTQHEVPDLPAGSTHGTESGDEGSHGDDLDTAAAVA